MDEIEQALRTAMTQSAEQWAAGQRVDHMWSARLMAGIRRRRRRHRVRAVTTGVAALAAITIAVPPVTHALWGNQTSGQSSAAQQHRSVSPSPYTCDTYCPPPASGVQPAPGTLLRDCTSQNFSDMSGSNWQRHSVRVGPIWFVWARDRGYWPASRMLGGDVLAGVGVPVIVAASAVVVVRIAPVDQARFKFLDGFNDTDRYTIATSPGASGVTFVGCPAGYMGPTTDFWVGYLDAGLTCIPLTVQTPGHPAVRVGISTRGGVCQA